MKTLLFVCGMGFMLFTGAAVAQASPDPGPSVRYVYFHDDYLLHADGTAIETRAFATKILRRRAVSDWQTATISYSTSVQKLAKLQAYTLKPDGRRLEVPKSNFQVNVDKGRGKDAPVFSDIKTVTIVFPEVSVGDTLVLSYQLSDTQAMFPGQFSTLMTFPRSEAYDDVRVRFVVPNALWVQFEGRQMAQRVEEQGDHRIIEWTYQNRNPARTHRRNYSVYDLEADPGIELSTFHSYRQLAQAYAARAETRAVPTPAVRRLAARLTRGKTTVRAQARALYDWVSTRISYAGNCIGMGAVVPHDLGVILANRMGDCKDHAVLLQALLAARGIPSVQVLINAGNLYVLPRIPVVSAVNHVINYIPGLNLYVDSTAGGIPFGLLPLVDVGKPVLWAVDYQRGTHTPVIPPGTNQQHMKTVLTIHADGTAQGRVDVSVGGLYAAALRAQMRSLPPGASARLVQAVFEREGRSGSGTFEGSDPGPLRSRYHYTARFVLPAFLDPAAPGAFAIGPVFFSEAPVSSYALQALLPIEHSPVACANGYSSEEYVYHFPARLKLLAVPKDLDVHNDFLAYHARYRLRGHTLTVTRVFDDRTPVAVCSPARARAYRALAAKALANLRQQVLYR